MTLINFFFSRKRTTANIAKERLQIIVAEQRRNNQEQYYFKQLKIDLIKIISKYNKIAPGTFSIQIKKKNKDLSIQELNIIISSNTES